MSRNIFIIGAQCAGKTTLVNALRASQNFKHPQNSSPVLIQEVVRSVMSSRDFAAKDFGTDRWEELQRLILEAQCRAEDHLADRWFISDRSGIDPLVYMQVNASPLTDLQETQAWKRCRQRMRDGFVVLCEAGNHAWLEDDKARLTYDDLSDWVALNDVFRALLEEHNISYHVLSKDLTDIEERTAFVLETYASLSASKV